MSMATQTQTHQKNNWTKWLINPLKLGMTRSNSIEEHHNPPHFTPEMAAILAKRRESLEKLQVDKPSPWMHLHDFE